MRFTAVLLDFILALCITVIAAMPGSTLNPDPADALKNEGKDAWYICTVDETKDSGLVPCQHPGGLGL